MKKKWINAAAPMAACAAIVLAGCAPAPLQQQPAAPVLPEHWSPPAASSPRTPAANGEEGVERDWWRGFGSDELDALVNAAQTQSLDLAAAIARVRQADAAARIAGASLLPTVNGTLSAGREARLGGRPDVNGTVLAAGLFASYEVDFWGANRASADAALATLQASTYERDTVRLTVTAGVANAWLQAVSLRERGTIAQRNLDSAQRLLTLIASRARAGSATPLELAQQRGLVASQQRTLATLQQQEADARGTIALLLGQAGRPPISTASLAALTIPVLGPGLPTQLLTRRPDLARAEAQLTAASADLQAARAAMLPRLTLSADLSSSGERPRQMLDNPLYSLAAGLTAPIFDGGRLRAVHAQAQARREELLAGYRSAIVAAFGDVDTALNTIAGLDAQHTAQAEELAQAQRALELAESRYRAGAETLLILLDTQRTLYAAQDTAVQLKAARLRAMVDLGKALGGGWQQPTGPQA